MNHEKRDDLWELLGHARPAKISPFFARNILRAIRIEKKAPSGFAGWLRRQWPIFAATAACLVVLAGFVLIPRPEPVDSLATLAEHVSASPDYSVIWNLDELLAAEESSAWLNYSGE